MKRTLVLATIVVAGCKQAETPPSTADQARKQVDDFYAWYVPIQHDTANASMRAIRERATLFSADLADALRADSIASATSPDEVIGLDGDPFLNSQDPCDHYASTGVTADSGRYMVAVKGTGGCAADQNPNVVVQVTPVNGKLIFTNFIYAAPDSGSLLKTLKDLATARQSGKPK